MNKIYQESRIIILIITVLWGIILYYFVEYIIVQYAHIVLTLFHANIIIGGFLLYALYRLYTPKKIEITGDSIIIGDITVATNDIESVYRVCRRIGIPKKSILGKVYTQKRYIQILIILKDGTERSKYKDVFSVYFSDHEIKDGIALPVPRVQDSSIIFEDMRNIFGFDVREMKQTV